jgi:hypothetical protein
VSTSGIQTSAGSESWKPGDADHRAAMTVDDDLAAQGAPIGAEAAPPQPVADHHRLALGGLEVSLQQGAPARRLDAEGGKEVAGDHVGRHPLGMIGAAEIDLLRHEPRQALEGAAPLPPVPEVRRHHLAGVVVVLRLGLPGHGQAVGVDIRQRLQQQRAHQLEDRAAGTDPEGQREDHRRAVAGLRQQAAPSPQQLAAEDAEVGAVRGPGRFRCHVVVSLSRSWTSCLAAARGREAVRSPILAGAVGGEPQISKRMPSVAPRAALITPSPPPRGSMRKNPPP